MYRLVLNTKSSKHVAGLVGALHYKKAWKKQNKDDEQVMGQSLSCLNCSSLSHLLKLYLYWMRNLTAYVCGKHGNVAVQWLTFSLSAPSCQSFPPSSAWRDPPRQKKQWCINININDRRNNWLQEDESGTMAMVGSQTAFNSWVLSWWVCPFLYQKKHN